MLFLTALVLAAPPPAPVARPICRMATVTPARDDDATPSVHRLDREPAARQVLAVLQTQGGCITPRVVRDSVGLNPTP